MSGYSMLVEIVKIYKRRRALLEGNFIREKRRLFENGPPFVEIH